MAVCRDTVADKVRATIANVNIASIGERLAGTCPVNAKSVQDLTMRLGAQSEDVQWEHVEASIRHWRSKTDPNERLNFPHYKVPDTNDHYRHYQVTTGTVRSRRLLPRGKTTSIC
jgi:hypothetical protein